MNSTPSREPSHVVAKCCLLLNEEAENNLSMGVPNSWQFNGGSSVASSSARTNVNMPYNGSQCHCGYTLRAGTVNGLQKGSLFNQSLDYSLQTHVTGNQFQPNQLTFLLYRYYHLVGTMRHNACPCFYVSDQSV